MARPLRIEFPNAFYHVMSRGNERKAVFRRPGDYVLFLETLGEACTWFRVDVGSYCLMPNHIHLLVRTEEANLSRFMKRLLGVYTIRFNRRYRRVGHLFQGRYKALVVDKDRYLLAVSRYIHLNPCRAGIVSSPEAYRWSSLAQLLRRGGPDFLRKDLVLGSFPSPKDYLQFVRDGLNREEDLLGKARGVFLGTEEFIERFREPLQKGLRTGVARQREMAQVGLGQLKKLVEGEAEAVQIYVLWKWGRQTQREIGQRFSKTDSAISHAIKRFEIKLAHEPSLRGQLEALSQRIQLSRTDPIPPSPSFKKS